MHPAQSRSPAESPARANEFSQRGSSGPSANITTHTSFSRRPKIRFNHRPLWQVFDLSGKMTLAARRMPNRGASNPHGESPTDWLVLSGSLIVSLNFWMATIQGKLDPFKADL
ncbi:MAG: hypothetical protein CMJ78_15145 [Planctomycetaceae bacterium]|nr:hypothetical protein [Planctomycetaceae bacterium]